MNLTNLTFPNATANAILVKEAGTPMSLVHDERCWDAVAARDSNYDGKFVFAVSTTGVYCRPSCPARRPRRENATFFARPELAEKAGFRACLRCRPQLFSGDPHSDAVKAI